MLVLTQYQKDQIAVAQLTNRTVNSWVVKQIIVKELIAKKIYFNMDDVNDIEMVKNLVEANKSNYNHLFV